MRRIDYIVVHCTATPQDTSVASIIAYWRDIIKWKSPGYHFIIDRHGYVTQLQSEDKPANGVKGHNANSIHISYIGGVEMNGKPVDNRTSPQKAAIIATIQRLKRKYPNAKVQGHRDFLTKGKPGWKDCPSFSAKEEYSNL